MASFPTSARAAGLTLGYVLDQALGDPRRYHPVAGFGKYATFLEKRLWRAGTSRTRGVVFVVAAVTPVVVGGWALEHACRHARHLSPTWRWVTQCALTGMATWAVLGGRSLTREAQVVHHLLTGDDLAGARARLSHLCSRDASELTSNEVARACVESIAENTSDAVVGALVWGAVAGVPGLLGFRAVNTLDAMVGYRNQRYRHFGWAAAKTDDLAGWLPARLTAVVLGPAAGSPTQCWQAWQTWRADGNNHPSPNAGQVEAAAAGALGVHLGGASTYGGQREERGTLGKGRHVQVGDIPRVATLCNRAAWLSLAALTAPLWWRVIRKGHHD